MEVFVEPLRTNSGVRFSYYIHTDDPEPVKEPKPTPVSQYTRKGVYVRDYDSISDACYVTGLDYDGIWKCCNGQSLTSGRFIWKYRGEAPSTSVYYGATPQYKIDKIIQLYEKGVFKKDISTEVNVSVPTINRYIRLYKEGKL